MGKIILLKRIMYILMILVFILLAACQMTPENSVIKEFNSKEFNEALIAQAETDVIVNSPLSCSDNFLSKDKKVNISINAEIIVPNEHKLPVIQIKPSPISEDMIQWAIDKFLEGKEGFYPIVSMTQSEIEEWIVKFQSELANEDKLLEKYKTDEMVEIVKTSLSRKIEAYKEMLTNAPEEVTQIPSNLVLRPFDFYVSENTDVEETELSMTKEQIEERQQKQEENLYLSTDVELSDGMFARLEIYNEYSFDVNNYSKRVFGIEKYQIHVTKSYIPQIIHRCFVLNCNQFGCLTSLGSLDQDYPQLTINEQDAITFAQNKLIELGIENYYVERVKGETAIDIRSAFYNYLDQGENQNITFDDYCKEINAQNKFYKIYFKPNYYEIPLLEANQAFYDEYLYSSPMEYESIMMRIAENYSIAEFSWINPTDVSNVINDNVEIISFETAMEKAKEFMKLKYNLITLVPATSDSPEYEEIVEKYTDGEIIVDEIKLGLAGISAYNESDEYLLIPVWNFYGSYSLSSTDDNYNIENEELRLPIVTVNAINGSIISQHAKVTY